MVPTGTWQFIASNPEATVDTVTAPGRRLPDDGRLDRDPGPFVGHLQVRHLLQRPGSVHRTNIAALEGEAEYEGPAFGKYVGRDAGASGAYQGAFTATAKLTADFGEEAIPEASRGEVGDFTSHSDHNLGDWQVILGSTPLNATNGFGGTDADGVVIGSVMADTSRAEGRRWESGAWEGAFFGNDVEDVTTVSGFRRGQL